MNNHRKVVLALYKSKLKLCKIWGYKYGTYLPFIDKPNLRKYYVKHENIGFILFSHIKKSYTQHKHLQDSIFIQQQIDYGFYVLRNFDKFLCKFHQEKSKFYK
jgi:hypothetical protein